MPGKIPVLSIIITTMALALGLSATELPFGSRYSLDTDYFGAGSLTSGDIDGDGLDDLVAAGLTTSDLKWWASQGDGTYNAYQIVASATSVDDVELADIDGDGDLDVLAAATIPINAVGWYENNGSPHSGAWPLKLIAISFTGAAGTATGDFDGNGTLDVVGVALSADQVTVALNTTGTGVGWSYEAVDTAFDGARWVSAGDIDSDGATDIAAAAYYSGEVAWWSRSSGTWTKHAIATVINADVLELADMDQDGDLDALGASQTGDIRWWENDGAGGTWTEHIVGDPIGNVSAAYSEDLDLDGDPDVIYSAYGADGVGWFENTAGNGLFWQMRVVDAAFIHAFDVTAIDFDGDGDPDLAAVDFDDATVATWENQAIHRNAAFPEVTAIDDTSDFVTDMLPVDFDQDGDSDLLVAELTGNELAWHENVNGDSSVWMVHSIKTGLQAKAVAAGDINCDGSTDAVMVTEGSATVAPAVLWFEDDGIGGWTEHTIVNPSPHYDDDALGLADLDKDGDLDLVLGSYSDGLEWYENDGCGALWIEHYLSGGHIWDADSMVLADIDGDGYTDVVVANSDELKWIPNELGSSGFFGADVVVADEMSNVRSVAVGDINGDGDLDIVAIEESTDTIGYWRNLSGDGSTWAAPVVVSVAYPDPRIIRLADFDLDGDLDLALAAEDRGTSASWVGWFENTSGGQGWTAFPATAEMVRAKTLALADFDGDGDPDLAYDRSPNDSIELALNRGGQVGVYPRSNAPPTLDPLVLYDVIRLGVVHQGRMGDADVELASLDLLLTDNLGVALLNSQVNATLHGVYIFEDDDDSSTFDPALDTQIAGIETFSLVDGIQHIEFVDGDSHVQIPFAVWFRSLFVAIAFETDAAVQSPDGIEIVFQTSDTVAEYAAYDTPLTVEWWPDVASGVVVPTNSNLIFEDDFESNSTSAWDLVVP